jgi:hypothetical protein
MNGKKNDEEEMFGEYFWSMVNKNTAPYRAACDGQSRPREKKKRMIV